MREPHPFDLLTTAVLLIATDGRVSRVNAAAEALLGQSAQVLVGQHLRDLLVNANEVDQVLRDAQERSLTVRRMQVVWRSANAEPDDEPLETTVLGLDEPGLLASIELRDNDALIRIDREERQAVLQQMNQSLLRNLGHEVKNPLGGIRGAAQLLNAELPTDELREYTQIIIKESDRLQGLVDRMLAPVRCRLTRSPVNIHEVLEHVRTLVLSEFTQGLSIRRDYDISLPEVQADQEQLIQLVLNIVRNAAQAITDPARSHQTGEVILRTRAARQVTLHRQRYRLALALSITDNGPGIPQAIRDEIFYPLVSGNPKGHGLGLTIAQTIVHQHGGAIDCKSDSSGTSFQILLPIGDPMRL